MILLLSSFVAGLSSLLSPCVLPILPLLIMSAWQEHKWAPVSLSLGLTISVTGLGILFTHSASFFNISLHSLQNFFAFLMFVCGFFLISDKLHHLMQKKIEPLFSWFHQSSQKHRGTGVQGQFILGLLLGGAWVPCTTPTLAFAISLALKHEHILQSISIILAYGLGMSLPFLILSYFTHHPGKITKKFRQGSTHGRRALGLWMIILGIVFFFDLDKIAQTWVYLNFH